MGIQHGPTALPWGLLKGAVAVIALLPTAWTLAYVLYWPLVQGVAVDFRFFWSWVRLAITGQAGEAPSTVTFLSTAILIILLGLGGYRQQRKRRATGADEGAEPAARTLNGEVE